MDMASVIIRFQIYRQYLPISANRQIYRQDGLSLIWPIEPFHNYDQNLLSTLLKSKNYVWLLPIAIRNKTRSLGSKTLGYFDLDRVKKFCILIQSDQLGLILRRHNLNDIGLTEAHLGLCQIFGIRRFLKIVNAF